MVQVESLEAGALNSIRREGELFFPLVEAVIAGSQEGKILVDKKTSPGVLFVVNKSGFSKFYASDQRMLTAEVLQSVYDDPRLPYYFHVYDPPLETLEFFSADKFSIKNRRRLQLRYNGTGIITTPALPEAHRVVDCAQVTEKDLDAFGSDVITRFWPSYTEFNLRGFGKGVTGPDGQVWSICFSAAIAGGLAEVDVATLAGHQSTGLGKASTIAFTNEAVRRGIKANWDCFTDNAASLKIATALNYQPVRDYTFLSIYNKERHAVQKMS